MKAKDVINEVLDAIVEAAALQPEENGNTAAVVDRIKRDVASLPERVNIDVDDDFEDDDTGVDADDVGGVNADEDKKEAKDKSDAGGKAKSGLKGQTAETK